MERTFSSSEILSACLNLLFFPRISFALFVKATENLTHITSQNVGNYSPPQPHYLFHFYVVKAFTN